MLKNLSIIISSVVLTAFFSLSQLLFLSPLYGQPGPIHGCLDCPINDRPPFGNYCPQMRGYGERRPVRAPDEALRIVREYFSGFKDIKLKVIDERRRFFVIEIRQQDGRLLDIVILDKRTGRLRSIF